MTLVGIPLMFILISIFEMSRGMWMYHTSAHAVKQGVRTAVVHGFNCVNAPPGVTNSCALTANEIILGTTLNGFRIEGIKDKAVGLEPANTLVTFDTGNTAAFQCKLDGTSTSAGCTSTWPPVGDNNVGTLIEIDITTPFRSALSMFWPGAGAVQFGLVNLGASSIDKVQF